MSIGRERGDEARSGAIRTRPTTPTSARGRSNGASAARAPRATPRRWPGVVVALAITTLGAGVHADPPPPAAEPAPAAPPSPPLSATPAQAADATIAALEAKDEAALRALSMKEAPDPWLVADELLARGRADAAAAFAGAAPARPAVEGLRGYVTAHPSTPDDRHRRASRAIAERALEAGDAAGALRTLDDVTRSGIDDVGTALLAQARARALATTDRLDACVEAYVDAADVASRIGWRLMEAQALYDAAQAAGRKPDLARALICLERDIPIWEALGRRKELSWALWDAGYAHTRRGADDAAIPYYERTIEASAAVGNRESVVRTMADLGVAYKRFGSLAKARETLERSLREKDAVGDRAWAARTVEELGGVYYALNATRLAMDAFRHALDEHRALGHPNRASVVLGGVALVHLQAGEFPKALEMFEQALTEQRRLGMQAAAVNTLINLGMLYSGIGAHAQAIDAQRRALAEVEALGDRPGTGWALANLALAHREQGSYQEALALAERAIAILDGTSNRVGAAMARCTIGLAHRGLGEHEAALKDFQRALALEEAIGSPMRIGNAHLQIGAAFADAGAYDASLEHLGLALGAYERLDYRDGVVQALAALARTRLWLGQAPEAARLARRAADESEQLVRGLAQEEAFGVRERGSGAFDVGAAAAAVAADAPAMSHFLERIRAGSLLDGMGARAATRSADVPIELRQAEARARAAEAAAARALRAALDAGELAAIRARRAESDAARAELAAIVARIERRTDAGAAIAYPTAASLDDIRTALASDDALVTYAFLPTSSRSSAFALLVTRTGARVVALGPASVIADAVAALRLADREADTREAVATLQRLVIAPLGLTPATKRVLVSPAAGLCYVPFAVLLPEATVVHVPSGTVYRRLGERPDGRGVGVLALGDPDYETRVDEHALAVYRGAGGRLARLPATGHEAAAVGTTTLLGVDATEAGLRTALAARPRWRAVHLACHGLVNAERPALSALALTASGDDDGYLSCVDVFGLEIPADLVVLSACETAKGRMVRGEGVVGLTRAFMVAGAPRVLCSLWKVDDEATRELMTTFYGLWNPRDGTSGLSAAEALRRAQAHVRSKEHWKHPFYWAAWVLCGLP